MLYVAFQIKEDGRTINLPPVPDGVSVSLTDSSREPKRLLVLSAYEDRAEVSLCRADIPVIEEGMIREIFPDPNDITQEKVIYPGEVYSRDFSFKGLLGTLILEQGTKTKA